MVRNVQQTFGEIVEQVPYLPEELQMAVANVDDPSALAHLIAGSLRILQLNLCDSGIAGCYTGRSHLADRSRHAVHIIEGVREPGALLVPQP